MTSRLIAFFAAALVACSNGCAPHPPTRPADAGPADRSDQSEPDPDTTRPSDAEVARPVDEGPTHRTGDQPDDAAALAGVLRPIDSPLPSRASLERGYSDPVAVLLELSEPSWPDSLVRANALAELGLFPERTEAMSRLLQVATDE